MACAEKIDTRLTATYGLLSGFCYITIIWSQVVRMEFCYYSCIITISTWMYLFKRIEDVGPQAYKCQPHE